MVAVQSTMQALGSAAPNFDLPDTRGSNHQVRLEDLQAKPLLVMFICNHCPFVVHIAERMASLANEAVDKGFAVVAISANDAQSYPQDGPDAMAKFAERYGFNFPYLYDQSQEVAQMYSAACTPDFFVFDADHLLRYRGQMDGARPGNPIAVTGDDLSAAINAIYSDLPVDQVQIPSIGCNIKWKVGNEPDYF